MWLPMTAKYDSATMKDRFLQRMKVRINIQLDAMSARRWTRREMDKVCNRLSYVVGDGLTDNDLRVYVRITNRELLGRREAT